MENEFPKMLYGPGGKQKTVIDAEAQARAGKAWKESPDDVPESQAAAPATDHMGRPAAASPAIDSPAVTARSAKTKKPTGAKKASTATTGKSTARSAPTPDASEE